MNVFDGQRTASPRIPANSSAASAPPVQLPVATAPTPFHSAQRSSNPFVISPSDHCWEAITSSQQEWRRSTSRRSKPIANRLCAGGFRRG